MVNDGRDRGAASGPPETERGRIRRSQLLDVGFELFADRDYEEVSIDDVAEAAGVSHGLLFQYFGSKRGFYVAVLERVIDEFRRRVTPNESLEPFERLRAALRANIDWAAEHPRGYRSLMLGSAGSREVYQLLDKARWDSVAALTAGLGADPDDPKVRVALRGWIGLTEAALLLWLETQEPDLDALIEVMAAALVGIVARLPLAEAPSRPAQPAG